MINKRSIPKIIDEINVAFLKLHSAKSYLQYIKEDIKYSNDLAKEEYRKSLEEAENEAILALWEVNKIASTIIKKIDPEALKELE